MIVRRPRRIYRAADISLQASPLHGKGVFAQRPISAGALIEEAPLILLKADDRDILEGTSLFSYYFLLGWQDFPLALGLGYASFYNHDCPANARYQIGPKKDSLLIKAVQDIQPGEEITLNYNGDPANKEPVHFPRNQHASSSVQ